MGTGGAQGETLFIALQKSYQETFRRFSAETGALQSLMRDPEADPRAIGEAKRRVEQAHSAYRESRDLLARFLQSGEASGAAEGSEVERLAHLLWEQAGRPTGRAEEHWYLAERMIGDGAQGRAAPGSLMRGLPEGPG